MSTVCLQCGKPAAFKCPICIQMKLPVSNYCSQDCFKVSWPTHKGVHVPPAVVNESWPQWLKDRPEFDGFQFTGKLRPGKISPPRTVPEQIERPEYALRSDGEPISERTAGGTIDVKTPEEVAIMREVCDMGVIVLETAGRMAKVGVTTDEIDRVVHEKCLELGCYPSPLNYRKFKKSCCTSVNEVICHGIPDSRPLEDGDIVNVDISVYHKGHHADLNETWLIGTPKKLYQDLVRVTYECLEKAIAICGPGQMYREIGNVISKHANKNGFSVVRSYCGHGIGKLFHTTPNVPHYGKNKSIGVMKPGHVFTIEPMINEGNWQDTTWPDDWTSTTIDGGYSAQFEHTILITEKGYEVLTRRKHGTYIDRFVGESDGEPIKSNGTSSTPVEQVPASQTGTTSS